jgi:transcription termination factor NusA
MARKPPAVQTNPESGKTAEGTKDAPAEKEATKKKEEVGFFGKIKGSLSNMFGKKKTEEKPEVMKEPAKAETKESPQTAKSEPVDFTDIKDVTPEIAALLRKAGYQSVEELKEAIVEDLTMIDGINEETAKNIHSALHPN